MQDSVELLGLKVPKNEILVEGEKFKAVRNWPKPTSVPEMHSLIGLLQFFCRFLPGFSEISAPLTNLTRKKSVYIIGTKNVMKRLRF